MALSRHHHAAMRPLSVKEISAQASQFDFTPHVALQKWIRAAKMLLTEAAICEQDGNLQMAYLYLVRHAELVLDKFPLHPDYRDPLYKHELQEAKRHVRHNFERLDTWRPRLIEQYERFESSMERRRAESRRVEQEREASRSSTQSSSRRPSTFEDDFYDDHGQSLDAGDDSALAVDLAHREIRRRDATRQSTRQAGISAATVASRRRGTVELGTDRGGYTDARPDGRPDSRDSGVREAGRYLQGDSRQGRDNLIPARQSAPSRTYDYPAVPAREETVDWTMPSVQPSSGRRTLDGPPPARPAKDQHNAFTPALPPKQFELYSRSGTATPSPRPPPTSDALRYTFKPSAYTEAGDPLRTVMLPPELRREFMNLADPNTQRNLETCGILCGTLISNALFINHLIIPDQKSTSDTCDTTEEGDTALFDYCDSRDLLVCGWIHTHPTQSCFLSSRDLHTSSGYQIMLPEAISIVCAPKHNPDFGIFRLTAPPGLPAVLNCHQQGLFHPHAETDLYTDALRPGHVAEGPGLRFEVIDLRKS
ncbi:hypothetical protein LTS10_002035 [Elasticomyces elasticus]|nr:hypothetical protein LTS10_002035 [Elasticomyces elasticus]